MMQSLNFIFLNGFWLQNVIGIAHAQIRDMDAHIRINACRFLRKMVSKIAQSKLKLKLKWPNSLWVFSSIISMNICSSHLKFLCMYRQISMGILQECECV
jgi:hypothetical protein